MQSCPADRDTGNFYRLEMGYRCKYPGPSHLDFDIFKHSCFLNCLKFIGNCPTRTPAGCPQLLLKRQAVHLYHHAVNVIRQLMALFAELPVVFQHTINGDLRSNKRIDPKAPVFARLQKLPM